MKADQTARRNDVLETILIVALVFCFSSCAVASCAVVYAFYSGWFTLPWPAPDRERSKAALPAAVVGGKIHPLAKPDPGSPA
jgi:hypothetical protein